LAKKKKLKKPPREYTRRQLSHFQRQRRRQRIVFISGVTVIAAIVLIVVVGWFLYEFRPMHQTVIKVYDTKYSAGYYVEALKLVSAGQSAEYIANIAPSLAGEIERNELIRQEAWKLGITVDDDEVKTAMKDADIPINDASFDFYRSQLLQQKLHSDYFQFQVPESMEQAHIMAMLLESESQALEIRARLQNSENFTALAGEFGLDDNSKNDKHGDYGWHPENVLEEVYLVSPVVVDYAFGAEAGTLSQPLYDEDESKQVGYWLIKVLEKQEDEAQIQALLLSSEEEAEDIKARLEAGEDLATLATEYSEYGPSKEDGGELGLVAEGDITTAFDIYVFHSEVETGVWSEPIRDDEEWTQGGYWLIKVVDKDDDRELDEEDRGYLIDKAYGDWVSSLWLQAGNNVDHANLTPEVIQWAVDRASKD
jgi:parvulin-like peptidyl-prolyl isomerase